MAKPVETDKEENSFSVPGSSRSSSPPVIVGGDQPEVQYEDSTAAENGLNYAKIESENLGKAPDCGFPPVPEPVFHNPVTDPVAEVEPQISQEVLDPPAAKRPRRDVLMPINLQEENSLMALLEVIF